MNRLPRPPQGDHGRIQPPIPSFKWRIIRENFDRKIVNQEEADAVARSIKILSFMLIDFKRKQLPEDARKILDEKTKQIFNM